MNKAVSFYRCLAALLALNAACLGCGRVPAPRTAPEVPLSPPGTVEMWLTTRDGSVRFQRQKDLTGFQVGASAGTTITVDSTRQYQSVEGFGYCLTGGSAYLIHRLADASRRQLLEELFDTGGAAIGISYLRLSIGASDLSREVFSYDDRPAGQTDTLLKFFSLGPDTSDLIPLLTEILAINPDITLLGSPWSAPAWMKTTGTTKGGSLERRYYGTYAAYLVKYIQAMEARGIHIAAITPQNEPLNPDNNPSMYMDAADEAAFIGGYLGPALKAAGLDTRIIIYDHNCDRPAYPLEVLRDSSASGYIDGTAFHLYAGNINVLSGVHDAFPGKHLYFTEQYTGGPGDFGGDLNWHVKNLIIGAMRNWSRNVLEWNLASDAAYQPHTPGGCTNCMGALRIGSTITRNVSYYIIASAAKFVRPGSRRIASNLAGPLLNVAFLTPAGKKVLIVLNDGSRSREFNIAFNGKYLKAALDGGAVGTFVW